MCFTAHEHAALFLRFFWVLAEGERGLSRAESTARVLREAPDEELICWKLKQSAM